MQAAGDKSDPRWRGAKHQGQAVMAAFKQDTFVMNEVAPPRDVQAQVAKMADHMLGLVEAALPVLTPRAARASRRRSSWSTRTQSKCSERWYLLPVSGWHDSGAHLASQRGFSKRLTLFDLVLIGTGGASGRASSARRRRWPRPCRRPGMLAVWGLGGAVTLAGALTFAELGAAMPRAGGQYVWLSEAYGGLVGFLHGWAYFLVVATGAIAALAVVFAEYVGTSCRSGRAGPAVALGALAALAAANVVGVRLAAAVGDVLTVAKLAALAGIVGLGCGGGAGAGAARARARARAWARGWAGRGMGVAMIGVLGRTAGGSTRASPRARRRTRSATCRARW